MCGIAGSFKISNDAKPFKGQSRYSLFSSPAMDAEDVLGLLTKSIESRGGDGVGVTTFGPHSWTMGANNLPQRAVNSQNVASSVKKLGGFTTWANLCSYLYGTSLREAEAVIIHTRKGSSGGNTLETTHPIMSADRSIHASHNGTLKGWKKHFSAKDMPVSDTTAIVRGLQEDGAKATLEKFEGPMTLVWVDTNRNTFNIYKDSARPLHYAIYDGYMYYASEAWMLYKAFDRCGADMGKVTITSFADNVHRSWNLATKEELEPATYTPCPLSPEKDYYCGTSYGNNQTYKRGNTSKPWVDTVKRTKPKSLTYDGKPPILPDASSKASGDWVVMSPFEFVKMSGRDSYKVTGYLEDDLEINGRCTPIDVVLFNVPESVKLLAEKYPDTKLFTRVLSATHIAESRSPAFSKGFIGHGESAIPFEGLRYRYESNGFLANTEVYKDFGECLHGLIQKMPTLHRNSSCHWEDYTVNDVVDYLHRLYTILEADDLDKINRYLEYTFEGYHPKNLSAFPNVGELLIPLDQGIYDETD